MRLVGQWEHTKFHQGTEMVDFQFVPVVMMAKGQKMVTYVQCEGFNYSQKGYQFKDNLRILDKGMI